MASDLAGTRLHAELVAPNPLEGHIARPRLDRDSRVRVGDPDVSRADLHPEITLHSRRVHGHGRGFDRDLAIDPVEGSLAMTPMNRDLLSRGNEDADVGPRFDAGSVPGQPDLAAFVAVTVAIVSERSVVAHPKSRVRVRAEFRDHDAIPGIDHPKGLPPAEDPVHDAELHRIGT